MPIEAFSCFKYMGTLKHNDQIISSAGQFETILKNKLYRPSRDSDSLCLDQSTARVLIPYDSYDMTHFDTVIGETLAVQTLAVFFLLFLEILKK